MPLLRAAVAVLILASAAPLAAQEAEPLAFDSTLSKPRGLWFSTFLGVQAGAAYFGADEVETGPAFSPNPVYLGLKQFSVGKPEFKDDPRARDLGFGLRGSFRFIGGRNAEDYDDLEGLDDIDPTLEVGLGLGYTAQNAEAFADLRYGIGGSDGWVGELGANYVGRPSDRLAFRVGPRLLYGSDNYADTYFGVSESEAARSGLDAYDPEPGLVSAGIEFTATYRLGNAGGSKAAPATTSSKRTRPTAPLSAMAAMRTHPCASACAAPSCSISDQHSANLPTKRRLATGRKGVARQRVLLVTVRT